MRYITSSEIIRTSTRSSLVWKTALEIELLVLLLHIECNVLSVYRYNIVFFFFQAEDGIRDLTVTGVQTCALPILGYFCVRLTQIYFAMLTLAFAMLVWGVAFKWKEVTGGDDGFTGIKVPPVLMDHTVYFYFTLGMVALGVALLWMICHSAFGLTLVAIRENSVRAGFIGVDTS